MANTLTISFDVLWDDDKTYNRLYKALQEAIQSGLNPSDWWSDTTSFYVVQTSENSHQFCNRIVTDAGLREDKDLVLVLNTNGKGGAVWGAVKDATLHTLLTFVKKL